MIKVLFFAQVRELVGTDSLTLDASELATVEAVRQQLAARGDRWALARRRASCWRRLTRR
ncbi:hypothetical protein KPZU09_27840 [Klebsiella pneumoniae]|uniref:Molybdenum cofactor biosynthesis protein MoaD n=1 Tax=Klebsiella pneumoniae TaxID=573 RepID=A0A919HT89_KLEPN|nr:hypothetical protein KPZU09_27840 [Klebsiella pneumoniae]